MGSVNNIVFGGSGFIGRHLIDIIKGDYVNYDIEKAPNNYEYCDVRRIISSDVSINKESVIYNLAALCTIPKYQEKDYYETNVSGSVNICNFAREKNIKTIIFTSSISPYGIREDERTEKSLPMPTNEYGISKLIAEHIHRTWQAEKPTERKLVILRPGIVFGKGEGGNFTRLYKAMLKGIFFYPGRKDSKKAAIYVKDLVKIIIEMADNANPGVKLFNCCYPNPHSIEEICLTITKVTGVRRPVILIPSWLLKNIAYAILFSSKFLGKTLMGIHPDRVEKLMISTNINGQKLLENNYILKYTLEEAIYDWFKDCNKEELI